MSERDFPILMTQAIGFVVVLGLLVAVKCT